MAKKTTKKTVKKTTTKTRTTTAKKTVKKKATKTAKPVAKTASKTASKTGKATVAKRTAKKAAKKTTKKVTKKVPSRPEPGSPAPVFTLCDQDGIEHTIGSKRARAAVLFFYPKDMTSGCTTEACAFRDLKADFAKAGADVFGISIMGAKSKQKFAAKETLNYPLLADDREKNGKPDPEVAQRFGVWVEKSMYGRTYMGLERSTFLIAKDGTVVQRWDSVKVPGHADEVLEAVHTHA